MIPTLFQVGPIPIHSFGLMMILCFLAAWRRLYLSLQAAGKPPELAERLITWAAVGGIVGARLGYIISYPTEFLADPLGMLFGSAGFVFLWGFLAGVLACYVLLRKENQPFLQFADLASPALAIGYAIGRIGCQLSGDGDYGGPAALPWAIGYPLGVVPTDPGVRVHPAPVYESLMAIAIAAMLLAPGMQRRLPGPGQLFGLYLLLTAAARFLVEEVRIEPIVWQSMTQAQLLAIFLAGVGALMMFRRRNYVPHENVPAA